MKLIRIEQNCVEVTWPYAKDFIKKALDISRGERDLDDIYLSLLHGQMQLWVLTSEEDGIFGACISQVVDYPKYKVFMVPWAGTKPHTIKKWYSYIFGEDSPLEKFAKEQGARRLEHPVRDGWLKFTKQHNFEKYYTTIVKDIK